MKHAFLIVVNTNFSFLNLLIQLLDDKNNDFFILIDAKVKETFDSLVTYIPQSSNIYEVPRMEISWASFSSVKAVFRLFKYAKASGNYQYYTFMQGSDFIIKKKSEITNFFKEHDGMEFIHFDKTWYDFAVYKVNYHHFFVNNKFYRESKVLKIISHGIAKIEEKMKISRNQNHIFSGSALFSISNQLCDYFLANEHAMLAFSKHTLAADEVVFQTFVMNSRFKEKLFKFEEDGGNLYYIDWARRVGNSPYTFSEKDEDLLLSLPSYYLFSRKFTETMSTELILKLYAKLKDDT